MNSLLRKYNAGKLLKSVLKAPSYYKRSLFPDLYPQSLFFYTFHKSASTLFSKYILHNISGYHYIDYADQIYSGFRNSHSRLSFKSNGFIYGPIRVSSDSGPVFESVVKPLTSSEFLRDKSTIIFVRDPRDLLVSEYYSYGKSHGFSNVPEIMDRQLRLRDKITKLSLDEYVLDAVDRKIASFSVATSVVNQSSSCLLLRYEDMINQFDKFSLALKSSLPISQSVLDKIYSASRPISAEDVNSHKRSGIVGSYNSKLKDETVRELNSRLANVLVSFNYDT